MKLKNAVLIFSFMSVPAFAQTDLQSLYNAGMSSSLSNIMNPDGHVKTEAPQSSDPNFIAPITASNIQLPKEKFVTNRGSGGWNFLMGPEASINEEILFYRNPDKDGGASFVCRRSQENGIIIVLNKRTKPFTKPVTVEISINGITHPQQMSPGPSGKINNQELHSLMFVGDAGIAIMRAMANVPSGHQGDMVVTYKGKTISTAPLPGYSALPYQATTICLGWNQLKHEMQMEHETILPTQAHVIGTGVDDAQSTALPK